ncbi:hypothetical protein [Acidisoma sp. L85]|uniref:hypothetical protein n=1 Tax=Acidisoma sp. L85 TaxID=1641850 RepID=UPI00131D1045|nr:hypothetical protein [Acidisoma sp. L85]
MAAQSGWPAELLHGERGEDPAVSLRLGHAHQGVSFCAILLRTLLTPNRPDTWPSRKARELATVVEHSLIEATGSGGLWCRRDAEGDYLWLFRTTKPVGGRGVAHLHHPAFGPVGELQWLGTGHRVLMSGAHPGFGDCWWERSNAPGEVFTRPVLGDGTPLVWHQAFNEESAALDRHSFVGDYRDADPQVRPSLDFLFWNALTALGGSGVEIETAPAKAVDVAAWDRHRAA